MVKISPPVMHDSRREAGTLQWVRRAFGCCFPVGWETLWFFLGTWSWLVHTESISHASEALPHLNNGTRRL